MDLERAGELYERALSLDPTHAVASNNLGSLLMRTKCFGYRQEGTEEGGEPACMQMAETHVLVSRFLDFTS